MIYIVVELEEGSGGIAHMQMMPRPPLKLRAWSLLYQGDEEFMTEDCELLARRDGSFMPALMVSDGRTMAEWLREEGLR